MSPVTEIRAVGLQARELGIPQITLEVLGSARWGDQAMVADSGHTIDFLLHRLYVPGNVDTYNRHPEDEVLHSAPGIEDLGPGIQCG